MSISVADIISRALVHLNDTLGVRWSRPELLTYVNDGQRRTVKLVPAASSAKATLVLANSTQQAVPIANLMLLDVVRNNNAAGTAPGRPVFKVSRAMLDAENINWQTKPTQTYVECFVYEPEVDNMTFYVYPKPPVASVQGLDVVVSVDPPDAADSASPPSIDPLYHEALIDYVVMRAIQRDSEAGNNLERVNFHAGAYLMGIGVRGAPSAAQ